MQNKTTLVQLAFVTLGQEMRWAYSTTRCFSIDIYSTTLSSPPSWLSFR